MHRLFSPRPRTDAILALSEVDGLHRSAWRFAWLVVQAFIVMVALWLALVAFLVVAAPQ